MTDPLASLQHTPPPADGTQMRTATEIHVYGMHAKLHPITQMPLENGSGALSADDQARRVHLPYIARTQGRAAANAILQKLNAAPGSERMT